jgi:UDP-glucose:(heptosyl)LPS alpha-1,3-glucosyltransferase
MRLALIFHRFAPGGGLESYLLEFADRLRARGHELHLVTGDVAEEIESRLNATVTRVHLPRGSALLRQWKFERAASRITTQLPVDATIGFGRTTTHDLHRASGGCHKVYSGLLPPWKRWSVRNWFELHLEKQLYTSGRTKLFVVNSAQVGRQIQQAYGVAPDRLRVIHTAVDTERYRPAEDRMALKKEISAAIQSDAACPAFLFASLEHRRKGLDVLLDIWGEVDADLWIAGKPLSQSHRRKIDNRSLRSKVHYFGSDMDLARLFRAADWFVHPTLYDACANTVLQSMASGLPGLISANDGAVEFVREGENGFVLPQPRDAASVLAVVRRALSIDEAARQRLALAARETMLPLTWDAHIEKWMNAIDEMRRLSQCD